MSTKALVVCATGITPEQKKSIARKVNDLGGEFTGDLTDEVTHMVCEVCWPWTNKIKVF